MAYGHGGKRPGAGRKPGSVNKTTASMREIALLHGPAAIEKAARLAGLVTNDAGEPEGMAQSEQVQIAALGIILDRAYGKPGQAVSIEGDKEFPSKIVMEIVDSVDGRTRGLPSQYDSRNVVRHSA